MHHARVPTSTHRVACRPAHPPSSLNLRLEFQIEDVEYATVRSAHAHTYLPIYLPITHNAPHCLPLPIRAPPSSLLPLRISRATLRPTGRLCDGTLVEDHRRVAPCESAFACLLAVYVSPHFCSYADTPIFLVPFRHSARPALLDLTRNPYLSLLLLEFKSTFQPCATAFGHRARSSWTTSPSQWP